MLQGKQAILFDLDGSLVDSMWVWKSIDIEYLGRFGLTIPEDLQKCIEGMSFSETAVYFNGFRFRVHWMRSRQTGIRWHGIITGQKSCSNPVLKNC